LLFALIFTFGFAFIYMLMINMGFGLLTYLVAFQIQKIAHSGVKWRINDSD
jgi:hypothetical protein